VYHQVLERRSFAVKTSCLTSIASFPADLVYYLALLDLRLWAIARSEESFRW